MDILIAQLKADLDANDTEIGLLAAGSHKTNLQTISTRMRGRVNTATSTATLDTVAAQVKEVNDIIFRTEKHVMNAVNAALG
jgi:hypothetical protein